MIIAKVQPVKQTKKKDDDDDDSKNGGTMIVDATCAPSNIRYPQDTSLLNEAFPNSCVPFAALLGYILGSALCRLGRNHS